MDRNALRIVCNPIEGQISYYFKNDDGTWGVLTGDSPLSRSFYTNTTMKERAKEIAEKIDEIYNRNNRGLDVLFEGTTQNFDYIRGAFHNYLPDRDIICTLGITKIAVVGKIKVGKTCLIEGMENLQGYNYSSIKYPDYVLYRDEANHAEWYEINGIDLGVDNIIHAHRTIAKLVKKGLSVIIYCVDAMSSRLEDLERDFVLKIVEDYPSITVLIVLTKNINANNASIANEIRKLTDQIKVVPTLAKKYEFEAFDPATGKEKIHIKKPFGLDCLSRYVFERR